MSRVRDIANILSGGSSAIATDAEITSAVTSAISSQSMAGKNFVINGGFDFFQRAATPTSGTTVSGGSGYSIDRWIVWNTAGNGSIVTSRQPSGLLGIQYCARIQRPSGNTSGLNFFAQPMETSNSIPLSGKTFTFSFYARKGANYSNTTSSLNVEVWQNTTTDGSIQTVETGSRSTAGSGVFVLTNSWQRFSFTSTFTSTTTQVAPVFYGVTSGTAGANDYYEITGVQLEIGSTVTTFSRAGGDIQGELAKCQRYFQSSFPTGTGPANNVAPGMIFAQIPGNGMSHGFMFPVPMRVTPSFITYNPYDNNSNWRIAFSGTDVVPTVNHMGNLGIYTGTTTGFSATVTQAVHGNWAASAEL
jgi:hypothetical protein